MTKALAVTFALLAFSHPGVAANSTEPRVAWGIARLESALAKAGCRTKIQVSVGEVPENARKPEGFRISAAGGKVHITGHDAAGAMYGCLELARRIRESGRLPEKLDFSDAPAMSLRGTCILLMKLGTYDYPLTPEEFPFFYDKKLWLEYLDFLAENRFNYIAFWNGHPFDYFVKLDRYPEAQDGMPLGLLQRNRDMLMWLCKEAERRNIWLMFQFYNIHTSVYFRKAHGLPAENSTPTPLLADYTGYCIERFVSEFPSVGLYICPGEALKLQYTDSWINDVILAAVKRTGKTPPIMVRSWGINLEHMRKVAGNYPRLYTERKFNVEMIASTEIDPENAEWAKVTGNHVVNVHCLGNLEPFRWSPPSYIQKCSQSFIRIGATGLHLYPRKAWRWPYGCDMGDRELQWRRDRLWFEAWGRYAWNPNLESDRDYWIRQISNRYGRGAAEHILNAYEAAADVLPGIQRLIWLGHDNHTVVSAGIKLDQLKQAKGIPFLSVPGMVRIPAYIEALKRGEKVEGTNPVDFLAARVAEAERAHHQARLGARAATGSIADAEHIESDMRAQVLVARFYLHKLKAAVAHALFEAGIEPAKNGAACLENLRASVEDFRKLTDLTADTYESMSDVPAWNPEPLSRCPYHWSDILPIFEKELVRMENDLAIRAPDPASANLLSLAKSWEEDSPIRGQMYDHVLALVESAQDRLPPLDSEEVWRRRKAEIREKLLESYGLDPMPARTPLNAQVVGTLDYPDHTLEKVTFEAWPGIPVSAHLYLPKDCTGPVPCVLYSCGHWYNGKTDPSPRSFCVGMVRHGIGVLIYDPMGQGERYTDADHGHRFPILAGLSQEGFMVWESIRALDYLGTRPEIDPTRIGMTGASGGGLNTMYTAAVEDRLAAVAPVCYPTTFREFIRAMTRQNWNGGVDLCNQVPGVMSYADFSDVMACAAPRPQLQMSATQDHDFPIAGARETAKRLMDLYAILSPGSFSYVEVNADHGYDKAMREAACGFFLKHLAGKGDGSPAPEAPMDLEEWNDPKLRCFPEGNRIAGPVMDALARDLLPRSADSSGQLSARVRAVCAVPAGDPGEPVEAASEVIDGISLRRVLLSPEQGIAVPVLLASRAGASPRSAAVIISSRSKADVIASIFARRLLERGLLVCAADLRGLGESAAEDFEIATNLWMLGRTLPGEWIADIECLAKYLKGSIPRICLVGTDGMTETAILAAAAIPEIDCLVANRPLGSYREFLSHKIRWQASAYIPGVLRHFDLPTALAAVAPRKALVLGPVNGRREPLDEKQLGAVYRPATGNEGTVKVLSASALNADIVGQIVNGEQR